MIFPGFWGLQIPPVFSLSGLGLESLAIFIEVQNGEVGTGKEISSVGECKHIQKYYALAYRARIPSFENASDFGANLIKTL